MRRSFGRGCTLVGLLIGGVLASGCQSDGSSRSSDAVTVLTEEQLEEALLTLDNVGDDFREVPPQDPNNSPPLGCLGSLDRLDSAWDEAKQAEQAYEAEDGIRFRTVSSLATSFTSVRAASDVIEDYGDDLAGCTDIELTNDEGVEFDLTVAMDSEKTTSESDQQLNLDILGSVSSGGLEVPVNDSTSFVRVDNHLVIVATGDSEAEGVGLVDPLTEIAVSRLMSVLAGEEPTDETVEAASSGLGPT